MADINFDTMISVRQAYLIMFEYLDKYWERTGKPTAVGDVLSGLALWDSEEGKRPIDASIFPEWLDCAKKVLTDENTDSGYRSADIKLK
jgi:hypothetical protein